MAQTQRSPAADRASAVDQLGRAITAENSTSPAKVQILDADGHRLPPDRHALAIEGAPTLATSSVWRWAAAERWAECGQ